jgi:hypothetical protein
MRWCGLPVAAAAIVLIVAHEGFAQIRFVGVAGATPPTSARKAAAKTPSDGPKLTLTSQIVAEGPEGPVAVGDGDGHVEGGAVAGYMPAEAGAPMAAGCAFGPFGGYGYGYGYNPDFGAGPNGMSVWPGIPACCDPWFGYCGEPRCYKCNCHQGTFQYYHCPHGACQPEILRWQRGDWRGNHSQPGGTCYGCAASQGPCPNCRGASYRPGTIPAACDGSGCAGQNSPLTDAPAAQPEPVAPPRPPRNDLPKRPSGPSARRTADSAAK